ncbi:hypothetical protein SAY87_016209 [Trapa incisa]|uniref:Homeobox domain-containing protein n=1 Tax=Trapa incisa TaxID=236973 RepID=A0AAN7L0W3_9MYRT|nr:hypothetical protein SAY87_016209 [Trapa incisa]
MEAGTEIDSHKIQHDQNLVSEKESNKKKAKTPLQLEALKEIYRVNKYPSDEIKAHLAQQLGLTETQVKHWFCNRRVREKKVPLKDATCADGRQDRSIGIILKGGSVFHRDSSGSTKQGNRGSHIDLRDTESRNLCVHDSPSADLTYELRSHYPGNNGAVEDTSSESSSALQEGCCLHCMDKHDIPYGLVTIHGIGIPASSNPLREMRVNYRPSGNLEVRGEIENVAITAVKRQLGVHYREDGPPLGIDFQPLPPFAFNSAPGHSALAFESYYDDDPALMRPLKIHQTHLPRSLKPSSWMRVCHHYEYKSVGPKVVHSGKKSKEKPPYPMVHANIPTNSEEGGTFRRITEVGRQGLETGRKHLNPIWKLPELSKEKMAVKPEKQVLELGYYLMRSPPDLPSGRHQTKDSVCWRGKITL